MGPAQRCDLCEERGDRSGPQHTPSDLLMPDLDSAEKIAGRELTVTSTASVLRRQPATSQFLKSLLLGIP